MSQNKTQSTIRIFLSYTRADQAQVQQLYQRLQAEGFAPWMDTEDLVGGQKFEYHIPKAIRASDFFLACLSCNSVNRRGFIQKEIKEALDVLQEKLDEDIYLIPVRLEDCEVPERLQPFQWINLYDPKGFDKLLRAIRVGIETQQRESPQAAEGQVKSIGAETGPKEWTEPTTGMEFVWIPPGRFMMGQTEEERAWLVKNKLWEDWFNRELPRHAVQIREGFWLGKHPVTQAQWLKVMGQNPSYFNEGRVGAQWGRHPVDNVSWDACQEFLRKLNANTPQSPLEGGGGGVSPALGSGMGIRLPRRVGGAVLLWQ